MSTVGIVCEYNPLHNGHLYHLNRAKEIAGDGVVISILTGYFSMRGDISVINKLDKVKSAINHGVDITIELPYLLGTQNADIFAYNAVYLLNKMGVNEIVAGSECNDISIIKKALEIEENPDFINEMRNNLSQGLSYRKSYSLALEKYHIELSSNDLLNVKYLSAINKIDSNIKLTLIQRINNNYNDKILNDSNIQSATAIRKTKHIEKYVPSDINEIYAGKGFYDINSFTNILKHLIITENLSNIFQANEGIENLFTTRFNNIDEIIDSLSNKRYTKTRIRRFITYVLTNTTKDEIIKINALLPRVTGFNEKGREYLNKNKKDITYFTRITDEINNIYKKELVIARIFSNTFEEDFIKMEQSLPYYERRSININ